MGHVAVIGLYPYLHQDSFLIQSFNDDPMMTQSMVSSIRGIQH